MTREEYYQIPTQFSGRNGNWDSWSAKLLAHASCMGYRNLLDSEEKLPSKDEYFAAQNADSQIADTKKVISL